ncbi:hypothetical protein [Defluviitalea phaphyphila]|uniref:hypothetical protein n=1 Tax=Defluviitalea phaphyphila TaxID=1473580 RepID=UPI000730311C|nr:hypothetical protein [Defluviitalea phaphyphila]
MIVIASKLNWTDNKLDKFFNNILILLEKGNVKLEIYKALDYTLIKMFEKNLVNLDFINNLINVFIKKLLNIKNNNNKGVREIEDIFRTNFINNLANIFNLSNKKDRFLSYESLEELIDSITYDVLKRYKNDIIIKLFIPLFKVSNKEIKKQIKDFIKDELSKTFNQSVYVEACINNIINPNKKYEQKLFTEIASLIKRRSKVVSSLINIIPLFYNEKLINIDQFSEFKGFYDLFDFIIEPNTFDFEKFDINWLLGFNNKFLEKILKIDNVKAAISKKLKEEIIEKNLDKRLKEIYFTYFA